MRKYWQLATKEDVRHVMYNLRKEDFQEGFALRGFDFRPWMVENFSRGTTYVMLTRDNQPGGLCGIDPMDDGTGLIWMVGTDRLVEHQIEFLKHSKTWINEASRPYRAVGNLVHAKNEVHLKWLRWCGFTFLRKIKAGPFNEEFYEFIRIVECA